MFSASAMNFLVRILKNSLEIVLLETVESIWQREESEANFLRRNRNFLFHRDSALLEFSYY